MTRRPIAVLAALVARVAGRERTGAVCLAAAAGTVDAIGYLAAGVFTANMTGNTVLVGIALGQGQWEAAAQRLTALAAFFAGAVVGSALRRAGHGAGRHALVVEAVLLAAVGSTAPPASTMVHAVAFAMGVQATAILVFDGVALSTVVLTSTMARIAERTLQSVWPDRTAPRPTARAGRLGLATWIAYAAGAALGAAFAGDAGGAMLAAAALVLAGAALSLRRAASG